MNCPACEGVLIQKKVGELMVDVCWSGCGGIWFDNFELKKVDEPHEFSGETLLDIPVNPVKTVDYQRKRNCPKCGDVVMMRHYFSDRRRVEVDECPKCGGVWLDAGELEEIRHEIPVKEEREMAAKRYFDNFFRADFRRTRARE